MPTCDKFVVFVLNGHPRAGKDTAADFMMAGLVSRDWDTANLSAVSLVKRLLTDIHVPWERKTPAERDLMAEMQSALLKYDWLPLRWLQDEIETRCMLAKRGAYFVHIREPDAIAKFTALLSDIGIPVRTVRIDRPDAEKVSSNRADASVDSMTYDLTIKNHGSLDDLRAACLEFINRLEGNYDNDFRQDDPALT